MTAYASRLGRLALAAGLAAARAAAGPSDGAGGSPTLQPVLTESHSGLADARREVVRDAASWTKLWGEIYGDRSPAPPPPGVDFAREMLVVAALGSRPSGGFSVAVTAVAALGSGLEVTVLESCPPKDAMVTMALTRPVQVVRVARAAGTPVFHETRGPSCP
jgi:hypothetical protein